MATPFKILVVEDNQQLLHVITEMLRLLGHEAHAYASAEEALDVVDTMEFDMLLTDINLPDMSGIDFAAAVVEKKPSVRVVFASGYGYLVSEKLSFRFTLLNKPYNFAQLQHSLKDAVSAA